MKILLTSLCFICFYSRDSTSNVQDKTEEKSSLSTDGKIYTSKVSLFLDQHSQYIIATRLSSFPPSKPLDTILVRGMKVNMNSTGKPSADTITYHIITKPGEQIHFESRDQVNFWLRESSMLAISFSADQVIHARIYGEGYIETPHAIQMSLNGYINTDVKEGSSINLQNDGWENITISLLKGSLTAAADGHEGVIQPTPLTSGREIVVDLMGHTYKITDCDTSSTASWKNAQVMNFSDANLKTILTHLDKWYRTHAVYDTLPKETYNIRLPYNNSLNNTMQLLNTLTDMTFKLEGDSIYVKPRTPGSSK
ncbi:MAG: DUF4974 domain-containing protein [Chitinophagaceae bacterium]